MNVTIFFKAALKLGNFAFVHIFCGYASAMRTRRRVTATTTKKSNISYWNFARHIAFMSLFAFAISIISPIYISRLLPTLPQPHHRNRHCCCCFSSHKLFTLQQIVVLHFFVFKCKKWRESQQNTEKLNTMDPSRAIPLLLLCVPKTNEQY